MKVPTNFTISLFSFSFLYIFINWLSNKTVQQNGSPKKVSEDSLSSASPRELLFHLALEKPISYTGVAELQGLGEPHPSPQLLKSKRVLQQTNQLLFDCVREVVESHAKKERGKQHYKKFLGPEELGKLISERITSWGIQDGDETNTNYFLDSVEEWRAFEQQKREIEFDIGDTILEEIKNEIVTEMIDFCHQLDVELITTSSMLCLPSSFPSSLNSETQTR